MKLRPMTMDDADKMLEWKNNPETRKYSIVSRHEIKKEDHYKWLKKNLRYFRVIESPTINIQDGDNQYPAPVGAVRIQDNEISIWIDRMYWGNHIASYIIEKVSEKGMTCKIVCANIASMRAFINAGFKPISFHRTGNVFIEYYILQK
jgi:RimJ/RimL family protein N-acetyltransferase